MRSCNCALETIARDFPLPDVPTPLINEPKNRERTGAAKIQGGTFGHEHAIRRACFDEKTARTECGIFDPFDCPTSGNKKASLSS